MSSGPVLIVNEKDFRIVRIGSGDGLRYVLEVLRGHDALGCEQWGEFKMDNQYLRSMFGYLLRLATKGERDGEV